MRTHLRIGRLLGVPIGLNWGVLLVCGILTVSLAEVSLPAAAPNHASSAYWFAGVIGVIGFMVSLVGHELGHSYIAGRNNVSVSEITLWLFGGVAKLDREADDPGAEFRIAAAGPAMSFVMAVIFGLLYWIADRLNGSEVLVILMVWLSAMNLILAVSNLLPAFPLDGGRMLRAMLWRRATRKVVATRKAALLGQILAAGFAAVSVVCFIWWSGLSGVWGLVLSLFLFFAARAEWKASSPQPEMLTLSAGTVGRRLPYPLMCTATIADLESMIHTHPHAPLFAVMDADGQVSSLVMPDAVLRVPPAQRELVPVRSYAEPLWSLPRVDPGETVANVLSRLGAGSGWRAVVSDGSAVQGVLCSEDVNHIVDLATA